MQLARLGFFHFLLDRVEFLQPHVLLDQGVSPQDLLQPLGIQDAFDFSLHFGLYFRVFSAADGFHQKVLQGHVVEGVAQDIEYLAAQGLLFHFDLVEELLKHCPFAGFVGHQVPQMADFGLADSMDSAEPLLQPVGVPGKVVVDHEVCVLQVHPFARSVCGDEHDDFGVVSELLLDFAPLVAVDASVNDAQRVGFSQHAADSARQVVQGVLVFGKYDEFATGLGGGEHFGPVLKEAGQFLPLFIVSGLHDHQGLAFDVLQARDFGLQLGHGLRGGRLVHHLLGEQLVLFRAEFLVEFVEIFRQFERLGHGVLPEGFGHAVLFHGPALRQKPGFLQTGFQTLAPALQGLEYGLRAGRQTPLQLGQRETDRVFLLAVQLVGAVHLFSNVAGHLLVQGGFHGRQPIVGSVRSSFRKKPGPVELQQVFFYHAPHQIRNVHLVRALTEFSAETVAVQKRQPDLKVLLLAVVGRGGHEQKMPGNGPNESSQLEAFRFVDLGSEKMGGKLVGFVHDGQVPLGGGQLGLVFIVARQLIHTADQAVGFREKIARRALLLFFLAEDFELEAELFEQLVLPLLHEPARTDDQNALGIGPHQQFANKKARHDRFSGAGVVGQDEPQGLFRQHGLVYGGNLVGKRLHIGGVYGHHGVEQRRLGNPPGLQAPA